MRQERIGECTFYIYPHKIPENKISDLKSILGSDNFGYVSNSKILFLKTVIYLDHWYNGNDIDLSDFNYMSIKCGSVNIDVGRFCLCSKDLENKVYLKNNYLLWEWFKLINRDDIDSPFMPEYLKTNFDSLLKSIKTKIRKHIKIANTLTHDLGDFIND